MNERKYHNKFFSNQGVDVHDDPVRFNKMAKLCSGKVLDLACGTGTLAKYYSGDYTGIDISDKAIELAEEKRRDDAKFLRGSVWEKPNPEFPKYDTIVLGEFLEHIEDEGNLFKRMDKYTKTGGKWLITVPNAGKIEDPDHVREFTVPGLREKFERYGRVTFHPYLGFEGRIMLTVEPDKEPKRQLALAMIAKNEEQGLEQAIISCIDIVDEIAVSVDSDSIDNTEEIARKYSDKMMIHEWQDDFSKARNDIQEKVESEWVLSLDGHEYVEQHPNLQEMLKKDIDGLAVEINREGKFKQTFPKIIRKEVKWKKPVHNQADCETTNPYKEFKIFHDRMGNQSEKAIEIRNEQRDKMVKEIMKEEMKEDPEAGRPYFYLGQRQYAKQNFKKAIKWYRGYVKHSGNKQQKWLVQYDIAGCYHFLSLQTTNFISRTYYQWRTLYHLWTADELIPGRWEIQRSIGIAYATAGWWQKAIEHLVQSFEKQKGNFIYEPVERNDAITWDVIGNCFLNMEDREKAGIAWERALKLHSIEDRGNLPAQRAKNLKKLLTSDLWKNKNNK